jgi:hypothetical protein
MHPETAQPNEEQELNVTKEQLVVTGSQIGTKKLTRFAANGCLGITVPSMAKAECETLQDCDHLPSLL